MMRHAKLRRLVRKFGLEYCDLPTMIWNISLMFRVLTLNIDSRHKKRIPAIFYILTFISATCYYYTYLFSMLWMLFVKCPETGDMVAAMVVLSLGVSSEIPMIKLCLMFACLKKIRNMIDGYLECDALVTPGSRFHQNLSTTLKSVKKRAMLFWITINLNAVFYILAPVFMSGRHLQEDLFTIYGLEPLMESPNFEIATFLMSFSVLFICYTTSNITAFIIIIAGYTEAHLLALSKELTNVWTDATNQYYTDIDIIPLKDKSFFYKNAKQFINIDVKRRLIKIIQNHSRNISLLREVEDIFRESIAIGFLFLTISIVAEVLGGLENTYLQVPFSIVQVAMDCFTGQRVIDASVTFERAVYDCKWENFDKTNMKIVLLMLQNSQKTLTLSAGGMTVLSFSTLMSILRSIYSTSTTLRSVFKNSK